MYYKNTCGVWVKNKKTQEVLNICGKRVWQNQNFAWHCNSSNQALHQRELVVEFSDFNFS